MKEYNQILKDAEAEMKALKHPYVGSEHLLLSILKRNDSVSKILNKYGLTYDKFKKGLINTIGSCKNKSPYVLHTPLFKRVCYNASLRIEDDNNSSRELLIALLEESEGIAIRVLINLNIDIDSLYNELYKKNTNNLDYQEVVSNNILIGRDNEINLIISSLLKKDKCNPILVGPAGVGKTAIVEELSRRLNANEVPDKLIGYKIIEVPMGKMVAGTKYRGEFEEKLNNLISSVENNKIILFIDEIHTLVNAGGADGAINAADILKPYLARNSIKVIGATTVSEYNETILKDKALNRRFDLINVLETDYETTKDILNKVKIKYENFHDIEITDENLETILKYSDMYIHNKYNPDKALDVLDLVCARVNSKVDSLRLRKASYARKREYISNRDFKSANKVLDSELKSTNKIITEEDILAVVSNIIKCDLITSKDELYSNILKEFKSNIINQYEPINRILANIKYKLHNDGEILSMLFLGGRGVGKSYSLNIIAKALNRNKIVIDLDSPLYDDGVDNLIGSKYKKEYVFEAIKNNPCSIIEVNDIDKTSYQVLSLFENILDKGYILDYKNEKIDFSNTIIVFTSKNIKIGFGNSNSFNINVDDIIEFNKISKEDIDLYVNNYNVINKTSIDVKYILDNSNFELLGFKDVSKWINKYNRSNSLIAP